MRRLRQASLNFRRHRSAMQTPWQAVLVFRRHQTARQASWQNSASASLCFLDVGRFFGFSAAAEKQQGNDCKSYLSIATRKNKISHEGGKLGQVALS